MAHRTQRVEKLMKEFMQYHNNGYSILEIAEIFHVTFATVYNRLQEIADLNGVSRESLLERDSSVHSTPHQLFLKEKVDAQALLNGFNDVENNINKIIAEIDNMLEKY